MNKLLIITLFSLLIINLTFKSSSARIIADESKFKNGIKRYVLAKIVIITFLFCSIKMELVKHRCTNDEGVNTCRHRMINSISEVKRERRSATPSSVIDTLFDENVGVRIANFNNIY